MRKELLEYLCCPKCGKDIAIDRVDTTDGSQIESGKLKCSACNTEYPIENGVPNFLLEQKKLSEKTMSQGFEFEWNFFFKQEKSYFLEHFLQWVVPLKPEDFKEKVVLDAGCGMGRNTLICQSFGPKAVIGFDIHEAVGLFYRNSKHLDNLHVVKADIFHMPFKQKIDVAYSTGVIHHTPEPWLAFSRISEVVKQGGVLSIFVYGREGNTFVAKFISYFRVHVFSKMANGLLLAISKILGTVLYVFLHYFYRFLQKLPCRAEKLIPLHQYFDFLVRADHEYCVLVVFDHLVTPIAFYHTRNELEGWYHNAGFRDIQIWNRCGVTYVCYGRKK